MKKHLNEKCAVFGMWGPGEDIARNIYFGLFALQHRGQENSGIATTDGGQVFSYKGSGLVSQIYTEDILKELPGFAGIGHNRYSTSHGAGVEHAQPIIIGDVSDPSGHIAFAHNGNIPNTKALIEFLSSNGQKTEGASDSTLMARAI